MQKIFLTIQLLFFLSIAVAQKTVCEVVADSLKGSYEGDCKKGKADGEGKATGTDSYEGSFKNGLPDGKGMYVWRNGDVFTGNFKKGLKDGKGTLMAKSEDRIITGYWKKDVYKGEYEKPYELHNVSSTVSHQDVNKIEAGGASVTVSMESGIMATADITHFELAGGNYQRDNKREMGKTKVIEFQEVRFPFRVRFNINGGPFDIEIFEPGTWQVNIIL